MGCTIPSRLPSRRWAAPSLSGYRYELSTADFSTATAAIRSQVANARLTSSASTIGVYLAGFDEVVGVFHSAQSDATLSTTAWYGSDGEALSAALLGDSEAAAFANTVGYPNPIFGLDHGPPEPWQPVANAIQARTGIQPDAYALSAYDALFVVDRALDCMGRRSGFRSLQSGLHSRRGFLHGRDGFHRTGCRRRPHFVRL